MFKKKEDYIDYTLLQKKGLLEAEQESKDEGFLDMTEQASQTSDSSSEASNPLAGFFGATENSTNNSNESYFGSSNSGSDDISALKIKIEDLEYKFERLMEKLDSLEKGS